MNLAYYVYCFVRSNMDEVLNLTGVEGRQVALVSDGEFAAVVHESEPIPYQSQDPEVVKKWVLEHNRVVETLMESYEPVIPVGFDTIIAPSEESAKDRLLNWMRRSREEFALLAEKLKGRREYAVRVLVNEQELRKRLSTIELQQGIDEKPRGLQYMYRQKAEKELKARIASHVEKLRANILEQVASVCAEISEETAKHTKVPFEHGTIILVNLSCLVEMDKVSVLGDLLDQVSNDPCLTVHFSGPWPAYTFASTLSPEE